MFCINRMPFVTPVIKFGNRRIDFVDGIQFFAFCEMLACFAPDNLGLKWDLVLPVKQVIPVWIVKERRKNGLRFEALNLRNEWHDANSLSGITATFTGTPEKTLLPKTAEPAAPCATYCYHATSPCSQFESGEIAREMRCRSYEYPMN
jgi:hypothetical protein